MFKIRKGLFREAAMRIAAAGTTYSCNALSHACRDSYGFSAKGQDHVKTHRITEAYAWLISPNRSHPVTIADFEYDKSKYVGIRLPLEISQKHRLMALLMIGEAWEDLEERRDR